MSGIAGIPNAVGGGRLRPARAEDGVAPLLWEADALALSPLPVQHGVLPTELPSPMAGLAPLGWPLPETPDQFLWSSIDWAASDWASSALAAPEVASPDWTSLEFASPDWVSPGWAAEAAAGPERHSAPDAIRVAPGLLPDVPSWLPPDVVVTEPGTVPPRPPSLPEPLFPPPVLEGGAERAVSVPEGLEDAIHQPSVTDRPTDGLGWRITGGADAALLMMDPASGTLRFLTAPDFELPADADGDSRYEVIFEVRDSWGAAATQRLTITVEDAIWG